MALPCERLMCESTRCSYAGKSSLSSVGPAQVFLKNGFRLTLSFYEDYALFHKTDFPNGLMVCSGSTMKP